MGLSCNSEWWVLTSRWEDSPNLPTSNSSSQGLMLLPVSLSWGFLLLTWFLKSERGFLGEGPSVKLLLIAIQNGKGRERWWLSQGGGWVWSVPGSALDCWWCVWTYSARGSVFIDSYLRAVDDWHLGTDLDVDLLSSLMSFFFLICRSVTFGSSPGSSFCSNLFCLLPDFLLPYTSRCTDSCWSLACVLVQDSWLLLSASPGWGNALLLFFFTFWFRGLSSFLTTDSGKIRRPHSTSLAKSDSIVNEWMDK